jgi:hypothetical protein
MMVSRRKEKAETSTLSTKQTARHSSRCDSCSLWFAFVHAATGGRYVLDVYPAGGRGSARKHEARRQGVVTIPPDRGTAEGVIAAQLERQVSRLSMGFRHVLKLEQPGYDRVYHVWREGPHRSRSGETLQARQGRSMGGRPAGGSSPALSVAELDQPPSCPPHLVLPLARGRLGVSEQLGDWSPRVPRLFLAPQSQRENKGL